MLSRLSVTVSGGTGYLGRRLLARLVERGHNVTALVRRGSEGKVPPGCRVVEADVLDAASFVNAIEPSSTFVHLTGVPHPAPWKETAFGQIDLASLRPSAIAAAKANVRQFVYVSVAHPAPVMKAYIRVRSECEAILDTFALPRVILRPWYILGPGHQWPRAFSPVYRVLEKWEATRETALRLGTVTLDEMTDALVWSVEQPEVPCRILTVQDIRETARLAFQEPGRRALIAHPLPELSAVRTKPAPILTI